jgi:hypothetical protein
VQLADDLRQHEVWLHGGLVGHGHVAHIHNANVVNAGQGVTHLNGHIARHIHLSGRGGGGKERTVTVCDIGLWVEKMV